MRVTNIKGNIEEHASLYLTVIPVLDVRDPNAETVQERIHPGGNESYPRRDRKICNKVELT